MVTAEAGVPALTDVPANSDVCDPGTEVDMLLNIDDTVVETMLIASLKSVVLSPELSSSVELGRNDVSDFMVDPLNEGTDSTVVCLLLMLSSSVSPSVVDSTEATLGEIVEMLSKFSSLPGETDCPSVTADAFVNSESGYCDVPGDSDFGATVVKREVAVNWTEELWEVPSVDRSPEPSSIGGGVGVSVLNNEDPVGALVGLLKISLVTSPELSSSVVEIVELSPV